MYFNVRSSTSSAMFAHVRNPVDFSKIQIGEITRKLSGDICKEYAREIKSHIDNDTLDVIHELTLFIFSRKELDDYVDIRVKEALKNVK